MSALIFIFIPKKKVLLKFEGFLQLNRMTMLQFGSLIEIFLHSPHLQIEIVSTFISQSEIWCDL